MTVPRFPVSPNLPQEPNMGAIRPGILAVKMEQRQGYSQLGVGMGVLIGDRQIKVLLLDCYYY